LCGFDRAVPVVTEAEEIGRRFSKIWSYLAEEMAPVLASPDTGVDMTHLPKFVGVLLEENKAAIFVEEILKEMVKIMVRKICQLAALESVHDVPKEFSLMHSGVNLLTLFYFSAKF